VGTAKFVTGSTMRHVLVMTSTASIGLATLFLVDLADIYFLSLLGEVEVTSGIGFASAIVFFTISISIGLMIAMGALVSRAVGARRQQKARRYAVNVFVYSFLLTLIAGAIVWLLIPTLLEMLGAEGRTFELAESYLRIVVASLPMIGLAMGMGGLLRALGDAKRAMYLTLAGALVNAVLDPILIFGFDLGIEGAAWATVTARIVMVGYGLYVAFGIHHIIARFEIRTFLAQLKPITAVALPAILTNIATPIGAAYVVFQIAQFGDSAVAGVSIITRLAHVVFCGIFALSGAVGPIFGQNLGAREFGRIRSVFRDSLVFTGAYVLIASLVLYLLRFGIVENFSAVGESAQIIVFYCTYIAITFFFTGGLFVANAAFNNLGKPQYSTLLNFSRNTIGTIPFAYYGAIWYGPEGVLMGQALGGVMFGILGAFFAFRHMHRVERQTLAGAPLTI
jgi:MATE family, multidrug efflux pump